jgi:hypothetical protein
MDFESYWTFLVGKNPKMLADKSQVIRISVKEFKKQLAAAHESGRDQVEQSRSLFDRIFGD